ncbi:Sucrase/ferredoxin-like-domain-containing protein [Cubamyces lactineus]|nr:Sucrase/ferredoxin-like-domain-containing protein [Cubamyces lactineus]
MHARAVPHLLRFTPASPSARSRLLRDCHYHNTALSTRRYLSSTRHVLRSESTAAGTTAPTSSDPGPSSLAGTAPFHLACVLLHTHDPPSAYPSRSSSRVWRLLTLRARQWGGTVNFAWSPALRAHPAYTGLGEDEADRRLGRERYVASVFSAAHRCGRLEIPEVSLETLDEVDARLRELVLGSVASGDPEKHEAGPGSVTALDRRLHLYVCTHGARDCRCGEGGGAVARALRDELAKRGMGEKDVVLGEVAHVGGHKYAANVLAYPYGDWFGMVQDFDVPHVLDEILAQHARVQDEFDASRTWPSPHKLPPPCPPFWRGRMGLEKAEQLALI